AGQQNEFVAAQPGDRVALADSGCEPARREAKQFVAGVVPEMVVDALEVVEIEIEQREPLAVAIEPTEGLVERMLERCSVGKAGQRVVPGRLLRLRLRDDLVGELQSV